MQTKHGPSRCVRPQIPVPGSRSLASRARSTETTAKHLLAGAASCRCGEPGAWATGVTVALFGCIKFTDVKFTGEFFQNFTNPSFPKVYTAEPIYCLPDEVFALFNACQGTACMMHARLHAACKFACPPCKLHGTRWK